ncbi:division/cell wall cluster transcriptional repressor MraZ [Bifidobacteriaceae bacterium NR002]|nr:division/cell wall cluster transcriptional repressor MraZ [Bifidobacteriaceae bacterium NR002]MDZ7549378.1 division/cell wall cluster transcriptional repressor MraZ [Bifidobacteriaceae bacterium NR047]
MVRRAANKQPQDKANSSSSHSINQANHSAKLDVSQQSQMPLQSQVSEVLQHSNEQPVVNQNMQSNSGYYGIPQTAMPVVQQSISAPAFTSTPSGYVDSAAQAAPMPIAPSSFVQNPQYPQYPQYSQYSQPAAPQMPVLLGTYTPKIDDKGRVALPAKFRAQLGEGFVMARGQEHCVYVLPMVEFQRITTQIQRSSMSNKSARDYLRVFLSGAVDEQPDKQGRIVVPPMLRNYASLGNEIVVIGVGTRAEIWNKSAWEAYLSDREQGYADIADDVLPAVM